MLCNFSGNNRINTDEAQIVGLFRHQCGLIHGY